ncbi:MAG: hypothetical protein IJ511_01000 [Bacteroides sp.]|nr:hypothetical protein [Bacteroides sp.]
MNTDFLNSFENRVQDELLRLCTSCNMLNGQLLATEDIDNRWHELAPEYMADAVPEIAHYPTVSVAWAAYLGMAVAQGWDADWETARQALYTSYYGSQGFDDMDEHIVQQVLGLLPDGYEARNLETAIRRCAETAVTLIRREQIAPQSPMAFHVFARTCKVMFRLGAAMQLKRLGYKFEKMQIR